MTGGVDDGIRSLFEPLREHVSEARWPRSPSSPCGTPGSVLTRPCARSRRRAWSAERPSCAQGVKPSLENARSTARGAAPRARQPRSKTPSPSELPAADAQSGFDTEDLVSITSSSTLPGDGVSRDRRLEAASLCLAIPYALRDPEGIAPRRSAVQSPPASGVAAQHVQTVECDTGRIAKAAYDAMLGSAVQTLGAAALDPRRDRSRRGPLWCWDGAPRDHDSGRIALTAGPHVTFTRTRTPPARPPSAAGLLGYAVNELCRLPDPGPCAESPSWPPAARTSGRVPAMLSDIDPRRRRRRPPWIAPSPLAAQPGCPRCDAHRFDAKPIKLNMTRPSCSPGAPADCRVTDSRLLPYKHAQLRRRRRTRLRTCAAELGSEVVRAPECPTRQQESPCGT